MRMLNKILIEVIFDKLVDRYDVKLSLQESNYLITEEQGLLPYANQILNIVSTYCINYINSHQPNKIENNVSTYIITVPYVIFKQINLFFDKIELIITVHIAKKRCDDDSRFLYNNGYEPDKSEIKNGKLTNSKINLEFDCYSIDSLKNKLAPVLYHEFTHAYEDFNRLLNGGINMSDMVNNPSNIYYKQIKLDSEDNPYVNVVGNIFYLSNRTENNAFVGEAYGELDTIVQDLKPRSLKLKDILHNFSLWTDFINAEYNLNYLKNVTDVNIQRDVMRATTYMTDKKLFDYKQTINLLHNLLFHGKQRLIKKVQRAIENRMYKQSQSMPHPMIKRLNSKDFIK